ncbi:MAG: hypothetical protein EPO26_19120 [Chloroflexota bacterium]|nr:MAG: hypothetical protein EPO26_19120 [Chloroflexota bacterium]
MDLRPLWVDEAFSWHDYRQPLSLIVGARLNVHPPAFGTGMYAWLPLAGDSEFAMRLPAALVGALVVPLTWRVGRDLADGWVGLMSASLIALSPLALIYAREARMYSILMTLAMAAFVAADRFRRAPTGRSAVTFGLLAATATLTHYTAAAAWAVGCFRGFGPRRALGWWIAANVLVALAGVAWAMILLANRDAWANLIWLPWAAQTTPPRALLDWASAFAGLPLGPNGPGPRPWTPSIWARLGVAIAYIVAIASGAILALARPGRRQAALSIVLLAFGPPIAIAAIEPIRATWHIRFALVALPAATLLLAIAIAALRRVASSISLVALACALGVALIGFREAKASPFDDWRAVARVLRAEATPDDVVLGGVGSLVEYYVRGIARVEQRPVAIGRSNDETLNDLAERVGSATIVWLVPGRDPLMDPLDVVGTVLGRGARARNERDIGGTRISRIVLSPGARIGPGPALSPLVADFGGIVRLAAARVERAISVGVSLALTMIGSTNDDLKVFVHLLDERGATLAQRDVFIIDEQRRMTSAVPIGQQIRLEIAVEAPREVIDAGRAVGIGVYREANGGERLPLTPPAPEHRLTLRVDGD